MSRATLGLFGLGGIGRLVARRAQSFDMKVIACDPIWPDEFAREHHIERAEPEIIFLISLHLPLTNETRGSVGERELSMMKPDAVRINTARGGLVDERALLRTLREGRIHGAGLDAFSQEPPEDDGWFALENVVLGSHCAASTRGATRSMGLVATKNLQRDLFG